MPSTRNADGLFIAGNSDSDDSLHADGDQDFEETLRNRSKAKARGLKKVKDKGKGKAKDVCSCPPCTLNSLLICNVAILRMGSGLSKIMGRSTRRRYGTAAGFCS